MLNVNKLTKMKWLPSLPYKALALFLILVLVPASLSGCQFAKIVGDPPDAVSCVNLGDHGWCRYPISKKSFFVDDGSGHKYKDLNGTLVTAGLFTDEDTGKKYTWLDLIAVSVIFPAHSFAKYKSWGDGICHQFDCSNGVGSWSEALGDVNGHMLMAPAAAKK